MIAPIDVMSFKSVMTSKPVEIIGMKFNYAMSVKIILSLPICIIVIISIDNDRHPIILVFSIPFILSLIIQPIIRYV